MPQAALWERDRPERAGLSELLGRSALEQVVPHKYSGTSAPAGSEAGPRPDRLAAAAPVPAARLV
ncbi:MAG TPA: hypothetical protein VH164_17275, partial [Ktedonobacteraceae bacterium]|nr:hypothetical protein [Ktedonobacteraceae bacterium]